jgi:hypothetical protein
MADHENPVIAFLDDANATQHRIRQRARWLVEQLPDKELRKFAPLIEDMILGTIETQAYLKELRKLEHEKPKKTTGAAARQDAALKQLAKEDEEELAVLAQLL